MLNSPEQSGAKWSAPCVAIHHANTVDRRLFSTPHLPAAGSPPPSTWQPWTGPSSCKPRAQSRRPHWLIQPGCGRSWGGCSSSWARCTAPAPRSRASSRRLRSSGRRRPRPGSTCWLPRWVQGWCLGAPAGSWWGRGKRAPGSLAAGAAGCRHHLCSMAVTAAAHVANAARSMLLDTATALFCMSFSGVGAGAHAARTRCTDGGAQRQPGPGVCDFP